MAERLLAMTTSEKTRRRRLCTRVLAVLLLVTGVASSDVTAQPAPTVFGPQVLTGEQIRRSGAVRLSDVLDLLDGVRPVTIDGFAAWPGLAAGFSGTPWRVVVDGQAVDLSPWGARMHLNQLGLAVGDVERVEWVRRPTFLHGRVGAEPVLYFYTRERPRGVSASAALWARNETGDPGPFRYVSDDPDDQRNVDSQGPDAAASLAYRREGAAVQAGGALLRHYLTKPVLHDRVLPVRGHDDVPLVTAVLPYASLRGRQGPHRLTLTGWGAWMDDYPYVSTAGREVPVRQRAFQTSVRGHVDVRGGVLKPALVYRRSRFGELGAEAPIPVDWTADRTTARLEWYRHTGARRYALGGAMSYSRGRSAFGLEGGGGYALGRLYAEHSGALAGAWYHASGTVAAEGAEQAVSAFGMVERPLSSAHAVGLHLAYVENLFVEHSPFAYWMREGMVPPGQASPVEGLAARETRMLYGELAWRWQAAPRVDVAVTAWGSRHAPGVQAERDLAYVDPAHEVEAWRLTYGRGNEVGARVRMTGTWLGGRQELSAGLRGAVGAGGAFGRARRTVPAAEAHLRVGLPVADAFSLFSQLAYRSSSAWDEYGVGGAGVSGGYDPRVPAHIQWQAAFRAAFVDGRVAATLAFENVLGQTVRYHPLGDTFGLGVRLHLAARLGGWL